VYSPMSTDIVCTTNPTSAHVATVQLYRSINTKQDGQLKIMPIATEARSAGTDRITNQKIEYKKVDFHERISSSLLPTG